MFVLVLGTVLLIIGAVIFVRDGQWGFVLGLAVLELLFIAAFVAMLHMARQRHRQRPD